MTEPAALGTGDQTAWFPADPAELTRVRAHVRRLLATDGVDLATVGQAELLVSELATNIVLHTENPRLGVLVDVGAERVTVHVLESIRSQVPAAMTHAQPTAVDDDHGRGLGILDWLAAEWGISRRRRETITWFALEREQDR